MTFIKYPSITNHYQAKWIQKWLEKHPGLKDETYVVLEKLHGANLQIYFQPDDLYLVGTRKRWLEPGDKFYDVWSALDRIAPVLVDAFTWSRETQKSLRLFGELYGGRVQTSINYGPEQNIRFFTAMVDDELISTAELLSLDIPGLRQNLVPILGLKENLEAALAFDIDKMSLLTPGDCETPNFMEGVVIQPYNHVYRTGQGSTFLIKKKNPEYLVTKKKKKNRKPMESAVVELRVDFLDYITEARIDSIISQNGPFTDLTQLGEYIVLVLQDAKAEFVYTHLSAMGGMDKKTLKYIFNVGGLIANMLKTRL